MGIFDDYGVDPDEIKEASFDTPDGTYRFEISEAEISAGHCDWMIGWSSARTRF